MTFTIAICTRERPEILERTLQGLDAQTVGDFDVVVVDDGAELDPRLAARAAAQPHLEVVRRGCRNLSHARNVGWQTARRDWVAFLDDDSPPAPDFAEQLTRTIRAYPDAWYIGGRIDADRRTERDYVLVTVHPIEREAVLRGRWTRPWDIGFTICMAAPRWVYERLGGFDERLGPGVRDFPSAEDMDFNYRLLRAGGVAVSAPRVVVRHEQWRAPVALAPHFRGYMSGWSGFAMKHLRSGDVVGGLWLWHWGARDTARMFASAARKRSRLRLRIAVAKLAGLVAGTWKGATRSW